MPAVLAVVALVIAAAVYFQWGPAGQPPAPVTARPSPTASPRPLTVAEIYQTLQPSVVFIRVSDGSGTGVVVNGDGLILTALHVVEGAGAGPIEIAFADGTRSQASVLASDQANDIAVLQPEQLPDTLVPAVLGGGARVGDDIVAIGNQLGLGDSTTAGVVSGLGRTASRKSGTDLTGLVQFDAAVNPGSSGGPLVNTRGQVIGIVVALANPTDAGTFIGIGFAVPIGTAVTAGGDRQPQL